jgi:Tol biopolymer transport system component
MSIRRVVICLSLAFLAVVLIGIPFRSQLSSQGTPQTPTVIAGRNVNMVSGDKLPGGDPWLQRQNEPSIAVSSRNPLHLLAGANDYRTVDMPISEGELPGKTPVAIVGDAWLGVFTSTDGGESWTSTMLPGFPQETNSTSPLKGYRAAADPVVRSGPNGIFYYSGIAFNRDTPSIGVVFVARFIDDNNKEGGNTIRYIDTKIIAKGTASSFLDKPWIAVDQPRLPFSNITISGQSFPRHNVYIAYSAFSKVGSTQVGDIMFARSSDCGTTWSSAAKISTGNYAHQGAAIAIKPVLGEVLVAWRRFAQAGKAPDSIFVAQSLSRGLNFQNPIKVADIPPFDQPTTDGNSGLPGTANGFAFRTNSYPTMAVDKSGHVYLAWSQRVSDQNLDARVVLTSSYLGTNWTLPQPVANLDENGVTFLGHQIMPSLSFAAGKLILVWYDQRHDVSGGLTGFNNWILDAIGGWRHTMDVWTAVADTTTFPDLTWKSRQVSRYLYSALKDDGGNLVYDGNGNPIVFPVQFNCMNYPLFKGGFNPFDGDFIDVAAAPSFRLDTWRNWIFNTDSANSPVFHVAWTDNRDVRPPLTGDWTMYTPPNSDQPNFVSEFHPQTCAGGNAPGMRNQNIYTSRITWGIEAGSPVNDKPLNSLGGIARAFVVFIKNNTGSTRSYRLTIAAQPAGGQASFLQFGLLKSLDVDIAPYSTISRPVFISSSDSSASITININEINASGSIITGGLTSSVLINGDPANPDVPGTSETHNPNIVNANPNIVNWYVNPNIVNPNIVNLSGLNPNIVNPNIVNPNIVNTDPNNPNIVNPNIVNPNIVNPNIVNQDVSNPNIVNPNIVNPNIVNSNFDGADPGAVKNASDVEWKVKNLGTATTSYTLKTLAKKSAPEGVYVQLLVYRVHYTPAVAGAELSTATGIDACKLNQEPHHELVLNVVNPNIVNPNIVNPNIVNPNIVNSSIENATFSVAPGEEVIVDLRVLDTGVSALKSPATVKALSNGPTPQAANVQEFIQALGFAVTSQAVNSTDVAAGSQIPPADATDLVIGTGSLPDGVVQIGYNATLKAYGGSGNYSWKLNSGELPPGLTLGSGGAIGGTPTAQGTYHFIVRVDDGSQFDTQQYYILIDSDSQADDLVIVTTTLPSGVSGNWYGATLEAKGGVWPRTWSLASGALPDGLTLDSGGVISGTPTASGSFSFAVRVADRNGNNVTQALSLIITAHSTIYYNISGYVYSETGQPLAGAVLRGLPNTPVSRSPDGFYQDNVPAGWSGTVIPFMANHSFTPASRSYSSLDGNRTNQDYNYQSVSFSISGTVLLGGQGLAGVVMNGLPGNPPPTTDSYGVYNATVSYGWSATVTPTLNNYTFTPSSQYYPYVYSAQTTNYTATSIIGPASKLVFAQSPSGGVGGAIWTTQPKVEIQDAGGRRVTTDNSTLITLAVKDNPGGGSLGGPGATSITVINGVADFAGLSINKGGWGYTLEAKVSNPAVSPATSGTFSIEGFRDTVNTLNVQRQGHTATPTVMDEKDMVLITGGETRQDITASVDFYDPSINTFANPGTGMNHPRFAHTATALLDGKILIVGGEPYPDSSSSSEIFDPATGNFTDTAGMAYPRSNHRATLLQNGRVLITGSDKAGQPVGEIYDPKAGMFSETGSMNAARYLHTSTLLPNGKVLITGGRDNNNDAGFLSSAELYDPATDEFSLIGDMAGGARANHQATLLDNGTVLITGGNVVNEGESFTSAEIYDPISNDTYPNGRFISINNLMSYAHEGHQAVLLRDGTVLLIGGNNDTAGNEIFDPVTMAFRPTGPMSYDRGDAASAVLPDGRVLITGGASGYADGNVDTAEVWNALAPFPTHVISGTITYNGVGVGGVMLVGLPGHPMTNNGGYYEGLVMNGWSGVAYPTKPGYTFYPNNRGYDEGVTSDISEQNYTVSSASGVPFKLAFLQQPSNTVVGAAISQPVTVEVQDELGNWVDNAENTVTLSLLNPDGAILSGTLTVDAVEGVATFEDLKIDKVGTGYILRATSSSLTRADSSAFNITAPLATKILVETAANGSGTVVPAQNIDVGSSITVYAIARDAADNFIENVAADSWSLVSKTGGVVDGDLVPAGDGKSATFTGHSVGTGRIHAAKAGLTSTDSGVLAIIAASVASKIDLTGPAKAGTGFISEAFTVTSQDASGNPVNVMQDTAFNLSSNSTGTTAFYSDPAGTTSITQVTILSGHNSASFYYMTELGGTPNVTAAWASGGTDLGSATHAITTWIVTQQIVFRSDETGNFEIYAINADGSGRVRLTNNSAYDAYPSWSPGGGKIAFASDRGGTWGIYVMNADGSWQTRLTNSNDVQPCWSADGTKIAFSSARDGNWEIYVMNADGTAQTRLTDNSPASDMNPSWSPDGSKIAFESNRDDPYGEIYVMNADGTNPTRLTSNPNADEAPSWSPDGSKIAFESWRVAGANHIFVMNPDGTGVAQLTTQNSGPDSTPSWSPDGSKITFKSNRTGNGEIFIMNADGTVQTQLTSLQGYSVNPNWGGSKIAFDVDQAYVGEIYIMNADGTGRTNLTNNPANDQYASWSPDGNKIAFHSDRAGNFEIYTMNADGTNVTRLTNNSEIEVVPRWSPDGKKITYIRHLGYNLEIYVMNADGSGQTNLTNNPATDSMPSWSPDGRKIVFFSNRDTNYEIYTMNADGSAQTRLTNNSFYDEAPSWSPDGNKIVFESNRDGNFEIYVMNADGTNPTRLTNDSSNDQNANWSPDGRKIVFTSWRTGDGEIYVMNADGTNVTRLTNNSVLDTYPSWRPQPRLISGYEFIAKWGSYGSGNGQFYGPFGIAVDSSRYVYVADSNNNRIQKFTSSGGFVTKWGSSGTGNGQFDTPAGIAVDSSGYIYVADEMNHRIQKFTSIGGFVTTWGSSGTGNGQFNAPVGIAVDSSGYVYVADSGNSRIQKFTSSGGFITTWGSSGTGDGQFNAPVGIAVDSSGYAYVADALNHRIQKFTSIGGFVTKWGNSGIGQGQFNTPIAIAVDSTGYVYVADTFNSRIQKFTSSGEFLTMWGSYGSGDGQFMNPYGIAVDSFGYVYVPDIIVDRVQVFR